MESRNFIRKFNIVKTEILTNLDLKFVFSYPRFNTPVQNIISLKKNIHWYKIYNLSKNIHWFKI